MPETIVQSTNSYLDEVTGLLISKNTSAGHFILDENTGELTEIEERLNDEPTELDFNEIYEHRKNREFNKKQRVMGKPYTGRKIEINIEDNEKTLSYIGKDKRGMSTKGCSHIATEAKSSRTFLCAAISEQQRESTFRYYWSLDTWEAKKAYIKNLVRIRSINRRRKITQRTANLVKEQGFDCFLPNENNELIRVCKTFLLRTLGMKNDTLNVWIKQLHEPTSKPQLNKAPTQSSKSASVREWLGLLPKMPSHYCRASTSRIYVLGARPTCFQSIRTGVAKTTKTQRNENYFV